MIQITDKSGNPDQLRALVRQTKAEGADLIKLFATAGLGSGGGQTMTAEQIQATCSEAIAQGLRSVVHAIGDSGIRDSVLAGCTSIEHGTFISDDSLRLMAQRGTFFDPNFLVLHNYLEHLGQLPGARDYRVNRYRNTKWKSRGWCGFHDIDWQARQCDTGYWVRKSAQGRGLATEAANAMLRYAFGALGMQRVGLTHSSGNEPSRRIAEKLGFNLEGIQRRANILASGECADRYCYARLDLADLPHLEVSWKGLRVKSDG